MPKKIKIIQIIPTLDLGGAERVLIDLVNGLDKNLYEVKVICLKRFGVWGLELKNNGVEMFLIGQKNKLSPSSLYKLIKILKRERPDIVQTHLFGADIYGKIAAKLAGVKHIISTEHNLNYSEGGFKKAAKRFVFKYSELIAAVSLAVKNYIIEFEGASADKVRVIRNGVDTGKFLNNGRNYDRRKKILIGSVGRLTEQKGYKYLIDAVVWLDGDKIECLIAGDGELRPALEKQINKYNLTGKVKLAGWQKNSEEFFNNLDIFVSASLWEGLGLVILEAGLSGLPVIAPRTSGILEIIKDEENGLLYNPGDSEELAQKIEYLRTRPTERTRLGKNLQQKVMADYGLMNMIKEYEKLYLSLLEYENSSDK